MGALHVVAIRSGRVLNHAPRNAFELALPAVPRQVCLDQRDRASMGRRRRR